MSLGRYKTAGEIINHAARELGLGTSADPFAMASGLFAELVALLTTTGQYLATTYDWPHLTVEAVLTKTGGAWSLPTGWTDAGSDVLDLPADFDHMLPNTHWDRTNDLLVGGPLTPQLWQYRQAETGVVVWAEFRLDTNQLRLQPVPLGDRTLALEYASRAWVRSAVSGLGNGNTLGPSGWDTPEGSGDFVLFPFPLIVAARKLAWKTDRGQDTTAAQRVFDDLLDTYLSKTPRRMLGLSGAPSGPHLIDGSNVPDSGFGS